MEEEPGGNILINWRKFSEDPFAFVDDLNLTFRGLNLNLFQKFNKIQRMALWGSIISLFFWILCGFDSTPLQFIHVLYEGVPAWIQGSASLQDLAAIYSQYYGKEIGGKVREE